MKVLLDTHTLIWFMQDMDNLSSYGAELIENELNEVVVSVATLWEIAIKLSIGKLNMTTPFEQLPPTLVTHGITLMSIEPQHLNYLLHLPFHHRDPFDRLIIAQAITENIPIISQDIAFDAYPIKRLW